MPQVHRKIPNTESLEVYDVAFVKLIQKSIQIIEPDRDVVTPLKDFYVSYKKEAVLMDRTPMKYKRFRSALEDYILESLPKKAQLYQKNKTWFVENLRLVDEDAMRALYQDFYSLEKGGDQQGQS